MANEIYRVELDEQTFRLGESGNINLSDWEAVFGSKLINLVDGFLEKSGRDDADQHASLNNALTERYASARLEAEALLGQDLSLLISSTGYDLASKLETSLDVNGISLEKLNSSEILYTSGDIQFSIKGTGFNADLQSVINIINSGENVDQNLLDSIGGKMTSFEARDLSSGVSGVPEVFFKLESPSTDSNANDAEKWALNFQGLEFATHGSLPRDISSVHNWIKSGLSLESLFEVENSSIEAFSITTQTGQKVQIGLDGAVVSVPYQAREEILDTDGSSVTTPETITYSVTVQNSGGGNKFYLDGVQQQELNLIQGNTYVFEKSASHPLQFSTTPDGTHGGGSEYTQGVTYNPSGQVTITVTAETPDLYYYCSAHGGMGGAAATDVPHNLIDAVFELELAGNFIDFPVIDPKSDTISKLSIKDSNVTASSGNDIITSLQLDVSADAMVATLNDSVLKLGGDFTEHQTINAVFDFLSSRSVPNFEEFPYDQSSNLQLVEDGSQRQFTHMDMPYSVGRRQHDENGNWIDAWNNPIVFNDSDGISHTVASPSDFDGHYQDNAQAMSMGDGNYLIIFSVQNYQTGVDDIYHRIFDTETGGFTSDLKNLGSSNHRPDFVMILSDEGKVFVSDHLNHSFVAEISSSTYNYRAINDQSGDGWQSIPYNAFKENYDENQNWVDDQNAKLVFHDINGTRQVIASPSDFNLSSDNRWGDTVYMQSMGDGHYAAVFSVIDQQTNVSNLHYRIFDAAAGRFDGGSKSLGQVEGDWLNFGLHLEEPGRLLVSDYMNYQFAFEISHSGSKESPISSDPHSANNWYSMPYSAGMEQPLDGLWVDPNEQNIIFRDFSGDSHVVASPDSLADGLRFSHDQVRSYTMGNGDYLITYAVRDEAQNSSELYYRVFDTDTGNFAGQADYLGHMGQNSPMYNLFMEEPGRVVVRDFMNYSFSGEIFSDGNGNVNAKFNFNDPKNYDLVWVSDWGHQSRVTLENVPEQTNDNASPYAAIGTGQEFDLAAFITESNGEWQLKVDLFSQVTDVHGHARIIADEIFVPVVKDEDPPFVNIENLGDNKFGVNLAKLDANGVVHQLKYTEVVIQAPATQGYYSWGDPSNYWRWDIQETSSATVDYPVMPNVNDLLLTSDGNVVIDVKESASVLSDGSEVVGDSSLFDLSNFSSSVTGVFNGNIIGTSHDDVIMSEVGSVYIAGGDGNDRIGFISPFRGVTDETSVLIGGAGADKFYVAVSEWMPPFEILDFNPAQGDQIELSPSYARYDDFVGFDVEAGILNINFYDPFSFRSIDRGGNTYEIYEQLPYRTFVSAYDENGNSIGRENSDLYFTDGDGVRHIVVNRADLEAHRSFGNEALAESMGNGNYLIAYAVRDNQGGNNSTDIYYRIFDSELGSFTGDSKHLGATNDVPMFGVDRHQEGQVTFWFSGGTTGFSAEVMDDGDGVVIDKFRSLDSSSGDNYNQLPYRVFRTETDENGNWIGEENSDLYFTDSDGVRHVVAHRADLEAGHLFSYDQGHGAEGMGNGNYLITYSVRDNEGSNSTDIYYRIFDSELGSFTGESTYLGSTSTHFDLLSLNRQEDGRVLIQDTMNYSFSAEVTDDGNGVITDQFRAIDTSSGYPQYQTSYQVFRAQNDENGNWIGEENSDLYFTDGDGVRHVVAHRADLETDGIEPHSIPTFLDGARAESMGNGNYLIAYAVRDPHIPTDKIYYRIFDSELGSFTGGSTYLGSVGNMDQLSVYRQEDGRVLINDWNSFFAEVTDDGNGIVGDSVEELLTLSFDLGDLASDQEYENAIKIDDTIADLDIFGFNHVIGENVLNLSNFDYGDGNLGVDSGKIESDFSLVYGSRWGDWIEGSAADQQFITFDGSDRIYAAGGFDSVLFDGDAGEFSFKLDNDYSRADVSSGDFVGLGIGEDRTSIIWRSPDDPNIEVVISQPGHPYALNSGQEFSNQDFYDNGRSAVAKLDDGNLVAVYSRYTEANDGNHLFAQVFNPDSGELLGSELELSNYGGISVMGDFYDIEIFPKGASEFSVSYRDMSSGWMSASSDGSLARLQGIGLHSEYINSGNDLALVWRSPDDPGIFTVIDVSDPNYPIENYITHSESLLETFELESGNYLAVYPSALIREWGVSVEIFGKVFDPKTGEIIRDEVVLTPQNIYGLDWQQSYVQDFAATEADGFHISLVHPNSSTQVFSDADGNAVDPFGLHWSATDQQIQWVSPQNGDLKVTFSDPWPNWFDFSNKKLITQELSNGHFLALYPDAQEHQSLKARIFDPKNGVLISDEITIVEAPHAYFNWDQFTPGGGNNDIDAYVSDDGEIRIQYFDHGQQVFLSHVIGSEKAVVITDKDGNEKLLVDVEQVQFDDQNIDVQEIYDSLIATGEYEPPTLNQPTILGSGDDTFYGEDVADFVKTGGGDDHIMAAGGDDHIVVQGAGEVIVDAGSGRDVVEVDPTFVGGLTITNGQETEVEASSLAIVIDKPVWRLKPASDTATNTDYKITLDGGVNEVLIKDYFFTDEEGYVTTKDISIRHIGWEDYDGWDAGYTGMVWESVRGSNQDNQLYSSVYDRDKTDDYVPVVEDGIVYSMAGFGGDDVYHIGGGLNQIYGGTGDDAFHIDLVAQNTSIVGDTEALVNGQYVNPSLKEDGLPDYDTVNTNYSDVAYFSFEWPTLIDNPDFNPNAVEDADNPRYLKDPDSYIEQLGKGHFKVHHKLENGEEINVEMYDVEGAYFSDGEGGIEYHALTTGRPITSDDFGNLRYESNDVKFWVEHNDADYDGATTIAVVTTATKTVTDPVTKQRISYEEPTVKWKGLATEADSFVFSDVTINVINVAQTDLTGVPIEDTTVYGTAGIDLIIGDEFDNLIFGGANNDIIFGGAGNDEIYGEGGDDVLIGGVGDDILYGDYHEDALKPAEELDSKGKLMNASELDGDDIIVGGAGIDKIDSGEGQNVAASGDLSSVILNAELDEMHTFLDYDEDDLPV